MNSLKFSEFRDKNVERLSNKSYEKCESWIYAQWIQAIVGELGELANILKKVDRGDYEIRDVEQKIAYEIADTVTYIDILSHKLDIDLGQAIVDKFNIVSDRIGSNIKL